MFEIELQLFQTLQVEDLTTSRKLSFTELCALCNVNVQEDRFRLLRSMISNIRIILDEPVLRLCGFTGTGFRKLNDQLRRFLDKNRCIESKVISDHLHTVDWINLDAMLVLVKNEKAKAARSFIHLMRVANEKYREYELNYERTQNFVLQKQNHELNEKNTHLKRELDNVFHELHTLRQWLCEISHQHELSLRSVESEKNRVVEMERRFARRERERADIERERANQEHQQRLYMEREVERLQAELKKLETSRANDHKEPCKNLSECNCSWSFHTSSPESPTPIVESIPEDIQENIYEKFVFPSNTDEHIYEELGTIYEASDSENDNPNIPNPNIPNPNIPNHNIPNHNIPNHNIPNHNIPKSENASYFEDKNNFCENSYPDVSNGFYQEESVTNVFICKLRTWLIGTK